MFILLESKLEIAAAHRELTRTMGAGLPKRERRDLAHPGGPTYDVEIFTDYRYWYRSGRHTGEDVANPRRINSFGIYEKQGPLRIAVEVNTVFSGLPGRIAGFFARDSETNTVYLMHTGGVGGGIKGISQAAFLAWAPSKPIEVISAAGVVLEGLVVSAVKGERACHSVTQFIDLIAHFKKEARSGTLPITPNDVAQSDYSKFFAGSSGERSGKRSSRPVDYITRHADVVLELREWRLRQPDARTVNVFSTRLIDMGVSKADKCVEVYEVKTDASRQCIYTAVGQLMVHATTAECKKVLVFPSSRASDHLREIARRLGLYLVLFKLHDDRVEILSCLLRHPPRLGQAPAHATTNCLELSTDVPVGCDIACRRQ